MFDVLFSEKIYYTKSQVYQTLDSSLIYEALESIDGSKEPMGELEVS